MKRPNIPRNFNGQTILRRNKPQGGGVVGAKVGVTVGVVTLTLIAVGFDVVGRRVGIVEGRLVGDTGATGTYMDECE